MTDGVSSAARMIDVRGIPLPQSHRLVFDAFAALPLGSSLEVLVDHDPAPLREQFAQELPGAHAWDSAPAPAGEHRARVTKLTTTPLPRLVASAAALAEADSDAAGSIWQLGPAARDLDANVIAIPPEGEIARHTGPSLDVLIMVIGGTGSLETEAGTVPLAAGDLAWLPQRSQRRFTAGAEGLRYLTVHHRKPTLGITERPQPA